jgi:glutamate/tyrosine decarboxylase-like PLP-dependent enzyme
MFLCKSPKIMQAVFTNPNASYLASSAAATIPSPLNIGLENSRRFRALPAYAVLLSEGRPGMASLLANMTRLSRHVAAYLRDSPHYELLPSENDSLEEVFICVLFRAKSAELNNELVQKINETRQMYVSGTSWKGEKAVRIAVSNWRVDVERDGRVICEILECIAEGREFDICSRDA